MTQHLFWVMVWGVLALGIYIAFSRTAKPGGSMPTSIFLFFVLFMNYYFDMLPGYALDLIYLFIGLSWMSMFIGAMNKRMNV